MRDFCEELGSTAYAERFIVEVTEDAFVAKSRFQSHVLPMLREARLRVSIDDFGTGYSSLAQLADITADELKIDRSFITNIHERSRSQSILKAIEALSESLGMTVIAEGVETEQEAAFLQAETRIRYAQGFYYSKPIFMDELAPARGGDTRANSRNLASQRERSLTRSGSVNTLKAANPHVLCALSGRQTRIASLLSPINSGIAVPQPINGISSPYRHGEVPNRRKFAPHEWR